jgi:hypothetical protein
VRALAAAARLRVMLVSGASKFLLGSFWKCFIDGGSLGATATRLIPFINTTKFVKNFTIFLATPLPISLIVRVNRLPSF